MIAAVGGLSAVLATSIGIHVEHSDVPTSDAIEILDGLEEAIEARTTKETVVDSLDWTSPCDDLLVCLKEIRSRTSAEEIVLVRLFDGVTAVRLVAKRAVPGLGAFEEAALDLPRTEGGALETIDKDTFVPLVRLLFEEAKSELITTTVLEREAPGPPVTSEPWIWIAVGTSVALAVTGVIFKAESGSSAEKLARGGLSAEEYEDLRSSQATQEDLSRGLALGALAGLAASLIIVIAG